MKDGERGGEGVDIKLHEAAPNHIFHLSLADLWKERVLLPYTFLV
jgi:hypothetical protein